MTIITENHPKWPSYCHLRKCGEITASTDGTRFGLNCSRCPTIFAWIDIKDFLKHQQRQHPEALRTDGPQHEPEPPTEQSATKQKLDKSSSSAARPPSHQVEDGNLAGTDAVDPLEASINEEIDSEKVHVKEEVYIVNEAMEEQRECDFRFCSDSEHSEDDEMASNSKISNENRHQDATVHVNDFLDVQLDKHSLLTELKCEESKKSQDPMPLIDQIQRKCEQIEAKIDAQQPILSRICIFMEDMKKCMRNGPQNMSNRERLSDEATGSNDLESYRGGGSATNTSRKSESFDEYEKMEKITTHEELRQLETKLSDPAYAAKFLRYFQSIYALNGKREGSPFFKTVMRQLMIPNVLLPYSWKGSRGNSGRNNPLADDANNRSLSFKNTFPNFIRFMLRVVSAADIDYKFEHNESTFSEYLRQKYTMIKRYDEFKGTRRASSTRKRRKKQPAVVATTTTTVTAGIAVESGGVNFWNTEETASMDNAQEEFKPVVNC